MKRSVLAPLGVVIVLGVTCPLRAADRMDVGLLLGSTRATDEGQVLQFERGLTFQATPAWHVWTRDRVRVSIELLFLATPAFEVETPGASLPLEYAALFLTPGVRVTAGRNRAVALWGAVGGGFARYSERNLKQDKSPNPAQQDTNSGALQLGAGVDLRGVGWLGLRGELRDVFTSARNFSISTPRPMVHNVSVSGGLVVRF